MEYVLWFRTVNTVADGSSIALHLSPPGGDRLTMLSIYNDLDSKQGLYLEVFDQVHYATVVASHLARATWIKLLPAACTAGRLTPLNADTAASRPVVLINSRLVL